MKLNEYRETYYEFSGKASDTARGLAFAGIAVVWVFRVDGSGDVATMLPADLLRALGMLVAALALDLMQYVVAAAIWGSFSRLKETQLGKEYEGELSAPRYLNWPGLACFWGKLAALVSAYAMLSLAIWSRWARV